MGIKVSRYQCPGRFLGKLGRDPSVSKSNWLHLVICQFFYINLKHSIDSSKIMGNVPEVLMNFNRWLFLKLNRFIRN
jgi:hypothetical protein